MAGSTEGDGSPHRRAVFLDRDGTLNVDQVRRIDIGKLALMPGAVEAVRLWNAAGWPIVVVTNQSGIARRHYTEAEMHAFHRAIVARLDGGRIDAWYWCPHMPDAGCACRKPATGMLVQAARDRGIELSASFVVGDSWSDVEAAEAAGARAVLVSSTASLLAQRARRPDHVATDLVEAAEWTLAQAKR